MEYVEISCRYCGNPKMNRVNGVYKCPACDREFDVEVEEGLANKLMCVLDQVKMEAVSNLRHELRVLLDADNTDSENIIAVCRNIKTYLPDDFVASFYDVANSGSIDDYAKHLNSIDAKKINENAPFMEDIVTFTARSLEPKLITPLSALMTRYKEYLQKDREGLHKYTRLQTLVEDETKKVNSGYYFLERQWDVCLIYSSKDMDDVVKLLQHLEANNLTCFAAFKNLKHGRGARANYQKNIETAIDNSKVVVFVSSENSRSTGCDAIKFELPHIRRVDIEYNPDYRNNYLQLPQELRKPRIEYRLGGRRGTDSVAENMVKEFFQGLEYATDEEAVAKRVFEIIYCDEVKKDNSKHNTAAMGDKAFYIVDRKLLHCNHNVKGEVVIPHGKVHSIEKSAFENCEKITKIVIPNGVSSIAQNAFKGCTSLKTVVFSNDVKEIGAGAFDSCISLCKVDMRGGLEKIGAQAFQNCQKLREIEIPASVETIGTNAFYWCKSLKKVKFVSPINWKCVDSLTGLPSDMEESKLSTPTSAAKLMTTKESTESNMENVWRK